MESPGNPDGFGTCLWEAPSHACEFLEGLTGFKPLQHFCEAWSWEVPGGPATPGAPKKLLQVLEALQSSPKRKKSRLQGPGSRNPAAAKNLFCGPPRPVGSFWCHSGGLSPRLSPRLERPCIWSAALLPV